MKTLFPVVFAIMLISVMLCHAAGLIGVHSTGQSISYGVGDDGSLKKGASVSAATRFTDNLNGTITDTLTGLVWLKDANCLEPAGGIYKGSESTVAPGSLSWEDAITWSNRLSHIYYTGFIAGLDTGICGLNDGSVPGDWRLPNINELESLFDAGRSNPSLPSNIPFSNIKASDKYWSSTTYSKDTVRAWNINMSGGFVSSDNKSNQDYFYVMAVRDAK